MFQPPMVPEKVSPRARALAERLDQVVDDALVGDPGLKRTHIRQALRLVERKRCGSPAAAGLLVAGLLLLCLFVGGFVAVSWKNMDPAILRLLLPVGGILVVFLGVGLVFSLRQRRR